MQHRLHVLAALFLFFVIAGGYFAMAAWWPTGYIWGTYENLYGEWAQVFCFVVAGLLFGNQAIRGSRYRWFLALVAAATIYVALEEISWGQQIFDWDSPDFFREKNLQGETNIHNLFTGPYSTTIKDSLRIVLAAGIFSYGVLYPIGLRLGMRLAKRLDALGIAPPPLYAFPFFATGAFLELETLDFNEAEVAELMVGAGLLVTAVHYSYVGSLRDERDSASVSPLQNSNSRGLAARILKAFALVVLLSGTTTGLVLAVEPNRERALRRIENGYEKFASRYENYERWETAAILYERVLERKSNRQSVHRDLAYVYRQLGRKDDAKVLLQKALALDKARLARDADNASAHRSLVRTYRALDNDELADFHLRRALEISERAVEVEPDSHKAAYSLGRTYELADRDEEAFIQYQRAYELKPSSKDYRKGYYRTRP